MSMSEVSENVVIVPFIGGQWNKADNQINITINDFDKLNADALKVENLNKLPFKLTKHYELQAKKYGYISCVEVMKPFINYRFAADIDGIDTTATEAKQAEQIAADPDIIKDAEDVKSLFNYFDAIADAWQCDYSYSGYTNDLTIAEDYNIELQEEAHKLLSLHIVFYQVQIPYDLLKKLFKEHTQTITGADGKKTKLTLYNTEGLKYQDKSIWRSVQSNKGHLMRCGFAHKIIKDTMDKDHNIIEGSIKKCACQSVYKRIRDSDNDNEPVILPNHCNLWTARGDERVLNEDDFINAGFTFHTDDEFKPGPKPKTAAEKPIKDVKLNDIQFNDSIISMDYEELATLLNYIYEGDNQRTHDLAQKITGILCHTNAFKDVEELKKVVNEWYNGGANVHASPNTANGYIDTYFNNDDKDDTNKWFFSLIKYINDETIKQEYKNKVITANLAVDYSVSLGSTALNMDKVKKQKYNISEFNKLINDIRAVCAFYDGLFYIVAGDGKLNTKTKNDILNNFLEHPIKGNTNITLGNIIIKYVDYYNYDGIEFMAPEKHNENYINLFHGWKYPPVRNDELAEKFINLVRLLFDEVKDIPEDEDDKPEYHIYSDYVLAWIAFILKYPDQITKKGVMMTGGQGMGKGTMTDTIAELCRGYTMENIKNLDIANSRFNPEFQHIKFTNFNELVNVGDIQARRSNFDGLKTEITEETKRYEIKGGKSWMGRNYNNYMFSTNNPQAFNVDIDDRRYFIKRLNEDLDGHAKQFKELHDLIKSPAYMSALMWYFLNDPQHDKINFNIPPPLTLEKYNLIQASKSDGYLLLEQQYLTGDLADGIEYETVLKWCDRYNYNLNMKTKTWANFLNYYGYTEDGKYYLKDYYIKLILASKRFMENPTAKQSLKESDKEHKNKDVEVVNWIKSNAIYDEKQHIYYVLNTKLNSLKSKNEKILKFKVADEFKDWEASAHLGPKRSLRGNKISEEKYNQMYLTA